MLFGNRNRFSIEYELDDDPHGAWMFGRICYSLCGRRIGDYRFSTSLRDAMYLELKLGDAGNRENERLFSLDTRSLIRTLADSMYGNPVDDSIVRMATEEQWARHDVTPPLDVFNQWQIFLLEQGDIGRCVYHNSKEGSYDECHLKYGEFDEVLRAAMNSLEQFYRRYA